MATMEDFEKIDIRIGTILEASLIADAKYSTHKLVIDFGSELGKKRSCARLVQYACEDLIGKQVIAVINFPARQIGKHLSQVLTLGIPDDKGDVILLHPDKPAPAGGKLH